MKASVFLCFAVSTVAQAADWNQWRGPNRDGIAEGADLPDAWTEELQPTKIWESAEIPSDHYGGHGSVSVADGKVFAGIVWHRDVPTPTRTINSRVMGDLGHRGNDFSDELMASLEEIRVSRSARLRGNALKEFAKTWVEENLSEDQILKVGGWAESRIVQGTAAIPWADFEIISSVANQEFATHEEFLAWVNAQDWADPATAEKVIARTPNTRMAANDVVLALNLEDGTETWRFEVPGTPTGRSSASTPAIVDGVVYAMTSQKLYALDAGSGEKLWEATINEKRGIASSPVVADGVVLIQAGELFAINADTGEIAWQSDSVRATNGSPVVWKDVVICNDNKDLVGLALETGEEKWRQPGGGQGSPVVQGDDLVVLNQSGEGIVSYRLSIEGAQPKWTSGFKARRYAATPIIYNDHVYHFGSSRHMCMDLNTGDIKWEVERQSDISSPVLADGKLLVLENNGGFLAMIGANPAEYTDLGRAKVGALKCPTPAVAGNLAVIRAKDRILCFDLTGQTPAMSEE